MGNTKIIKRDNSIDVVGGFMILIMIMNHIIQHTGFSNRQLDNSLLLFSFFMPWFFFKAGMFYKNPSLKADIQKLLPPYLIYNIIGIIIGWFINYKEEATSLLHYGYITIFQWIRYSSPQTNLPLWFLFSFFMVKQIVAVCAKYNYSELKMAGILFIACFSMHIWGGHNLYYLMNIPLGFVYFAIGHAIKDNQYKKEVFMLSLLIVVAFLIIGISYVGMFSGNLIKGYFLLWPVYAVSGIVLVNNIAKYTSNLAFVRVLLQPLAFLGKNSMDYYVLHWLLLIVFLYYADEFNLLRSFEVVIGLLVVILIVTTIYIVIMRSIKYMKL